MPQRPISQIIGKQKIFTAAPENSVFQASMEMKKGGLAAPSWWSKMVAWSASSPNAMRCTASSRNDGTHRQPCSRK